MKLNIGCELCLLPEENGWINCDIHSQSDKVMALDVRFGLPYPNNYIEEIYGGNFFDHLTYYEGRAFLKECQRVLLPNAAVRFSVMDLDKLINYYLSHNMQQFAAIQPHEFWNMDNSTQFATFLLGNMAHEKEYTGHKMLYTPESITSLAKACGFQKVTFLIPDFQSEPWCVENPLYRGHVLYVEMRK